MNDLPFFALAAVCILTIIFLANFYIRRRFTDKAERDQRRARAAALNAKKAGLLVNCPLCNSVLLPGEDLFSRVYRPMNVHDQLCTIRGCPHCYPNPEPGVKRECPVCHKEVSLDDGHLVARLFNKIDGKKHVIVSGCNLCCKSKL